MAENLNPMAPHHLPGFIPGPSGEDPLFTFVAVFCVVMILLAGIIYLRLHSIPEKLVHGANAIQFQLVAILALIALLTHQNIYWIAALLLATIRIPDFLSPIRSIAVSLRQMARAKTPTARPRAAAKPENPGASATSNEG